MASSGSTGDSNNGGNDPWAWLGLLKWSLAQTTAAEGETPPAAVMSDEDKAFLEKVMKEGIINENDRMKVILDQVTETLTKWKDQEIDAISQDEEDQVEELLQELRDIVEQIDYARAFCSMKGLPFLLGCVQERDRVPLSTRLLCLGILATLCSNNPPVQKELLELGSIRVLSDLFFREHEPQEDGTLSDSSGKLRARILQAMSANVRSHDLAEQVFSQTEQAPGLLEAGLGVTSNSDNQPPQVLQQRTLFFLNALVTSDSSSPDRLRLFGRSVAYVADQFLLHVDNSQDAATTTYVSSQVEEMALGMMRRLLEKPELKAAVEELVFRREEEGQDDSGSNRKDALAARAVQRIAALRALTGEDRDFAQKELQDWEALLHSLAAMSTTSSGATSTSSSGPTLLLTEGGTDAEGQSHIPQ